MSSLRFTLCLVFATTVGLSLPAHAAARQVASDAPLIEIAVTTGHVTVPSSFRDNPFRPKALMGFGLSTAWNVTNVVAITGEFSRFGGLGTDLNLLLIGARVGRWSSSRNGHAFVEAKGGFADSRFLCDGEVLHVGAGATAMKPCSSRVEELRCAIGLTVGYRRGLGGQTQLSGFTVLLHFGLGLGSLYR